MRNLFIVLMLILAAFFLGTLVGKPSVPLVKPVDKTLKMCIPKPTPVIWRMEY